MSELGTLTTAFPGIDPWFDLRDYLVNGWESIGTQTCAVAASNNLLFWSARLNGDSATSVIFMQDIPGHLRPPQNLPVPIYTSAGASYATANRNFGRLAVSPVAQELIPGWDMSGELILTGTIPRGAPVEEAS